MFKTLLNSIKNSLTGSPSTIEEYTAALAKHLEANEPEDAILLAEEGLKDFPNNNDLLYYAGESARLVGDQLMSLGYFEQLLKNGSTRTDLVPKIAVIKMNLEEYDQAAIIFDQIQQFKEPEHVLAAAMTFYQTGASLKSEQLVEDLKTSTKGNNTCIAFFEIGYQAYKEGAYFRALRHYVTACTCFPEIENYYRNLNMRLANERESYFAQVLDTLIAERAPNFSDYSKILAAFDRKAYEEALIACDQAIVDETQQYTVYLLKLKAQIYTGEIHNASMLLDQLMRTLKLMGLEVN